MAASSASNSPAARRPGDASSTRCRLFYHVANIGDARSLAIHPAIDDARAAFARAEQLAAGVTPGYVRLSVGIENIEDIIADLAQALGQV